MRNIHHDFLRYHRKYHVKLSWIEQEKSQWPAYNEQHNGIATIPLDKY